MTRFSHEIADEPDAETVIECLEDAACRAILSATGEQALTAGELSEQCDLPTSTTYRKLEELTAASLLDEQTRIARDGKHASEYRRAVESVTLRLGGGLDADFQTAEGVETGQSRALPVSGD